MSHYLLKPLFSRNLGVILTYWDSEQNYSQVLRLVTRKYLPF